MMETSNFEGLRKLQVPAKKRYEVTFCYFLIEFTCFTDLIPAGASLYVLLISDSYLQSNLLKNPKFTHLNVWHQIYTRDSDN